MRLTGVRQARLRGYDSTLSGDYPNNAEDLFSMTPMTIDCGLLFSGLISTYVRILECLILKNLCADWTVPY